MSKGGSDRGSSTGVRVDGEGMFKVELKVAEEVARGVDCSSPAEEEASPARLRNDRSRGGRAGRAREFRREEEGLNDRPSWSSGRIVPSERIERLGLGGSLNPSPSNPSLSALTYPVWSVPS